MKSFPSIFVRTEAGTTSIEYALITSLLAVVIVVALTVLRPELLNLYERIAAAFS